MKRCIDLFSGRGGFSSAFEKSDKWAVTTLDNDGTHNPDIETDILDITHADLPNPDVVVASPPCTAFTNAACGSSDGEGGHVTPEGRPVDEIGQTGIQLAHYTVGLVRALDPKWYFIENPMGGMRNQFGEPDAHIWWCQYGSDRAKPTDLWGRIPPSFVPKRCYPQNPNCDHERASRGSDTGTQASDMDASQRAEIPYGLSKAIRDACENPEPVYEHEPQPVSAEQQTL